MERAVLGIALISLVLGVAALLVGWALSLSVAALSEKADSLSKAADGLSRAVEGLREGLDEVRGTVDEVMRGLDEVRRGLEEVNRTVREAAREEFRYEIVVVPVDRPIYEFWVQDLVPYIAKLDTDERTAGVIILIDSPGGTVGATEALYTALSGLNRTRYAVIVGMGTSGAYYTAMAAERVYATPSALVGSIGVLAFIFPDIYLMDVPDVIYTTGPLKYYGMDLFELYDAIEETRANFVGVVAGSRGERLRAPLEELETAAIFTARRALDMGLIDAVGGLWDAVRDMARRLGLPNYTVVSIYEKFNITEGNLIIPLLGGRVSLAALLNASEVPIYYLWPGAVLYDVAPPLRPPPSLPVEAPRGPYIVLDAAHANMVPRSFLEPLITRLAVAGYDLAVARTEDELVALLENATGLIVAAPMAEYGRAALDAVLNASGRGVRVAVFYDTRIAPIFFVPIFPEPGPTALDPYMAITGILAALNASTLPRSMYNASGLGAEAAPDNWQFVHVRTFDKDPLFANVTELVLFSPAPLYVSGGGPAAWARGHVRGYGEVEAPVIYRQGNITVVATMRSFTPYFINLGDNAKFLDNLVRWLVEERPIAPPRAGGAQPPPPEPPPYPPKPPEEAP